MRRPEYLKWLIEEHGQIENYDKQIKCFKVEYNKDPIILDEWALHIRRHYVLDEELEDDCTLLGLDVEQYLRKYVIPQKKESLGPTARSNTISEILFSDLLEFIYGYHVPRCRQHNMSGKTVSEHGTDVIGYKFARDRNHPNKEDRLLAVEVKAKLSSGDSSVISSAIKDSVKDEYRTSLSLNYMRKKLNEMGKTDESEDVRRFQKKVEEGLDYNLRYVAAGITSIDSLEKKIIDGKDVDVIPEIDGATLTINDGTSIFFVHGKQLMNLTHEIFERCIK